uniref:Uncharacterized protein n=1 Tax=Lynx canadensis TaxID=61383 RepID=A0A667G020_LYNCA
PSSGCPVVGPSGNPTPRLSMTAETSSQDLTRLCLTQTQQPRQVPGGGGGGGHLCRGLRHPGSSY